MSTPPKWLKERNALVIGLGNGVEAVVKSLTAAGATVFRGQFCNDLDAAKETLNKVIDDIKKPLDILIHGGDVEQDTQCLKLTYEQWRSSQSNNLDSKFFYSSAFAKTIIGTPYKGSILYLEPTEQSSSVPRVSASGAISSLTKTLAVEWAHDGLRVNSIVSDVVKDGEDRELNSLGVLATYLCSDFSVYVTGASVGIND